MSGQLQSNLARSLEKILEEAHLSGELKLSGRKLKEFPHTGRKYNLSDTVIAGKAYEDISTCFLKIGFKWIEIRLVFYF